MVVDDGFSVLDFFFFFFCLISFGFSVWSMGFEVMVGWWWWLSGLMVVAEWVDGGGWVGVDWFEDEYFIWINVCDRKIDMGVLKK